MDYEKMTKAELIREIKSLKTSPNIFESKKTLQSIIDNTTAVIYLKDIQGKYILINRQYELLFHVSKKEIVGETDYNIFPEDKANALVMNDREVIKCGTPLEFEEVVPQDDGLHTYISIKFPLFSTEGIVYGVCGISTNITARKKAEVLLQEKEQQMRLFMLSANDSIWNWDMVAGTVERNIGFERAFGYTMEEIDMRIEWWAERLHPDDKERVWQIFNDAVSRGQKSCGYEYRFRRCDGSYAIIEDRVYLEYDGTGKVVRSLGAMRDITERKQSDEKIKKLNETLEQRVIERTKELVKANKEIKESEDRYSDLFENVNDMIQSIAPDGRFIYVNEAWRKVLGYSKEETNKLTMFDIIHPDSQEHCMEVFKRVISGEKVENIEAVFVARDGREIIVEGSANCRFEKGIPAATRGIFRDITVRKHAVEKLLKSEERYRSLINDVLDTSNVGVFILDKEFRVVWINKSLEFFFGLKRDEVIMKDKRLLIKNKICHTFDDGEKFMKRVLNTYNDNTYVETFVCHILSGDGREERWLEHWSQPITSGLYNGGRVEHYTDITKRKLAEEALLQSEKLKALGIMTSGVAHEFNNILASISANAQYLEERYRDDKALTKVLRTICRVADDGADIVDRMYEFTSARKDKSGFIRVDIKGLIKQAIDFTMPRWKGIAQARGINYHIDRNGNKALPAVSGSPSELREVFVNIINNALEAMPDGGRLSFSTRREDSSVFISISDTGIGMSEEVKKRIFDPFFTTRSPEGTGLGMSITYGIITRHAGNIDVESEVGKGSTITISLPIPVTVARQAVTPEPVKEISVKSLNVLLVDDEQDICESLSDIFAVDGHKVKSVNSGREAMELLRNNTFDLVICDLVMPGVTGRDVIKALETQDKRPKIGIMTGWKYNIRDAEDEGLKVDFIVRKPFKISELRKDINKVFNS